MFEVLRLVSRVLWALLPPPPTHPHIPGSFSVPSLPWVVAGLHFTCLSPRPSLTLSEPLLRILPEQLGTVFPMQGHVLHRTLSGQ